MSVRILLIQLTPSKDNHIDLNIYRDAGQLVINGINPYNFEDNIELRQSLRTDEDNFNEFVSKSQDLWNFYANSNLPMATLFFGCIEYCFGSPLGFRYSFAFFDSLLALLILAFVMNKWKFYFPNNKIINKIPERFRTYIPLILGLLLGALSPILLLWGTYITEPKGTGLLLILAAVYFSESTNNKLMMLVSPVLLGFSVAFIGLGIFIGPLCLFNIYKNNKNSLRKTVLYLIISILSCSLWLLPFLPHLISMMFGRLTNAVDTVPQHGSMWLAISKNFPSNWHLIRVVFIILFISVNLFGLYRKKLDFAIFSAGLLYFFTCIYLMNGSMDRMNISIVSLIIISGFSKLYRITYFLLLFYLIYGIPSFFLSYFFGIRQDYEGFFVLLFTGLYTGILIIRTFQKEQPEKEFNEIIPA
jgi:hypothetical protein